MKEKEDALKSLKTLQQKTPQITCLPGIKVNNEVIENLIKEREEAHIEIMNLNELLSIAKSEQNLDSEEKDNLIRNLEDQVNMDEIIKIELNNKLEKAFAEIKDLTDNVSQIKRPTKNKSTNTTEKTTQDTNKDTQGPIDLTLPNRTRASHDPKPVGLEQTQNQYFPSNSERTAQDQIPSNSYPRHRNENHQKESHYQKRQDDYTPDITEVLVANLHKDGRREISQSTRITLHTRFTPKTKSFHRSPKIDYYDFALKDNRRLRTKNRPICPWFQKNKCHSDVCVYQHPDKSNDQVITLDDISDTSSNYEQPKEICRYHLQNRCWFGTSCYNKHENEN